MVLIIIICYSKGFGSRGGGGGGVGDGGGGDDDDGLFFRFSKVG